MIAKGDAMLSSGKSVFLSKDNFNNLATGEVRIFLEKTWGSSTELPCLLAPETGRYQIQTGYFYGKPSLEWKV
jgi:hypothetical protein